MLQALGARGLDAEVEHMVPVLLKKAGEMSQAGRETFLAAEASLVLSHMADGLTTAKARPQGLITVPLHHVPDPSVPIFFAAVCWLPPTTTMRLFVAVQHGVAAGKPDQCRSRRWRLPSSRARATKTRRCAARWPTTWTAACRAPTACAWQVCLRRRCCCCCHCRVEPQAKSYMAGAASGGQAGRCAWSVLQQAVRRVRAMRRPAGHAGARAQGGG